MKGLSVGHSLPLRERGETYERSELVAAERGGGLSAKRHPLYLLGVIPAQAGTQYTPALGTFGDGAAASRMLGPGLRRVTAGGWVRAG